MKIAVACILAFLSLSVYARETITMVIPGTASVSTNTAIMKMIARANELQNKYNFVIEFKPGGNGVVAIKYMDLSPQNRIVGVAPAFIENARTGLINENDYVAIHAPGDVCWALITNVGDTRRGVASLEDLRGKSVTVGGTGYGNAAHITSLMLAEKYGFQVKYIVFKSNFDAVVNMVGNHGINMALEGINVYNQFKDKNPALQILGFNCVARSDSMPELRTLREQGFDAPIIFNITMASRGMAENKRQEIGQNLEAANKSLGAKEFSEVGLYPPVFREVAVEEFAKRRIGRMKELVSKFKTQIESTQ